MTTNRYIEGDLVVTTARFYDTDGQLADPDFVKIDVVKPGGTTTTYVYGTDAALTKTTVGVYQIELTADTVGTWFYYWYAPPGDGQTAQNGSFVVLAKQQTDFSFDPALGDDISIVRFNIADAEETGYFIADQTIRYYLTNFSVGVAVVRCLQNIVAQLSTPNFKLDWLQVSNKEAREGYEKLLKQKAIEYGVSLTGITASSTVSLPSRADSYEATNTERSQP